MESLDQSLEEDDIDLLSDHSVKRKPTILRHSMADQSKPLLTSQPTLKDKGLLGSFEMN